MSELSCGTCKWRKGMIIPGALESHAWCLKHSTLCPRVYACANHETVIDPDKPFYAYGDDEKVPMTLAKRAIQGLVENATAAIAEKDAEIARLEAGWMQEACDKRSCLEYWQHHNYGEVYGLCSDYCKHTRKDGDYCKAVLDKVGGA